MRVSARLPFVLAVAVVATSLLVGLAVACLPNLAEIIVEPTAEAEAAPPPFVGCGDGIIASLDDGGDAGESCDPGVVDAQAPGCKSCQLACENGGTLDRSSGHCYFAAEPSAIFQDAITRCGAAGAHLVTIGSLAEADLVKTLLPTGGGAAGYWVGLSRIPALGFAYGPSRAEEPGFPYPPAGGGAAGPCEGCFGLGADGGSFPLEDAAAPESSSSCIASVAGTWLQVACNTSRTIICEREPVGRRSQDCFGGFCFTLPATVTKKAYILFVSATDPDRAAQTCAGLEGGSLAVLDSAEEREQLAHEIIARDPTAVEQEVWIGLAADGGAWSWEDGVAAAPGGARPLPWGNAQPDAAASTRAYMRLRTNAYDTQLAYADDGGKAPRLYVCQRPPQ